MKLQSNPKKSSSPIYELNVPYFKNGTVKEWMKFLDNLEKVIIRQDLSTGPTQFSMARQLLSGDMLAQFNNKALAIKNKETVQRAKNKKEGEDVVPVNTEDIETHANLKKCLQAVTISILPPQALQTQKRYMGRLLQKPVEMKVRDYFAQYLELNSYLKRFPPFNSATQMLPTNKVLE